jgi:hypothetical protein
MDRQRRILVISLVAIGAFLGAVGLVAGMPTVTALGLLICVSAGAIAWSSQPSLVPDTCGAAA